MPTPFKRLSVAEFAQLLDRFPFSRRITSVHMHHTWRPNHAQFRGHDSIVAMWRFHTQERGFSDIAQHLTIDPEGFVWTGRNWNAAPASASGYNGNANSGPFMFETVGDFDRGMDPLAGAQREAVLDVIKLVQKRFKLEAESLMFHNQMAPKSCPGTGIDRNEMIAAVSRHEPSTAREAASGPFGPAALASSESVEQAIALLTDCAGVRGGDPPDAELDYGDEMRSALVPAAGARGDAPLGPEALESLRPHVVNLRMGQFSHDGLLQTRKEDVDALFDQHLPHWLAARKAANAPARVLFYAHGGLVKESVGLAGAAKARAWWMRNGVYPVFFIWETGLFETLGDLLRKIKGRAVPEGARDIFDWTTDPVVEEAARALQAPRIWGAMKVSAALANNDGGGARYVAQRLGEWLRGAGQGVELHAVGHSAGSIFHSHFLPACRAHGAEFASLQLLAPAVTCAEFKRYLRQMSVKDGKPPRTTMFSMNRHQERADNCAQVYRKSLLYLVSEACEPERKTPILGLEDSVRADAELRDFFGLRAPSASGEAVWSKSATDNGRSATRSASHGGFDDDGPTMNSVLRRVAGLQDADPIDSFPQTPGSRAAASEWNDQADWPEAFARAWSATPAPAQTETAPSAPSLVASTAATGAGRRSAVCIGINAYPTAPLGGCVDDAKRWQTTLSGLGFGTRLLTDGEATRERLLAELGNLIDGSRAGDVLVFQYAGHGTQVEDLDGDEAGGDTPGQDEAICPFDFAEGRFLVDDDIAAQVARLPNGVRLYFLLDCCHSGTGSRFAARAAASPPAGAGAKARYVVPTPEMREKHRAFRATLASAGSREAALAARMATMREVTFSACKSSEVAWEVEGQGEFTRRAHEVLAGGSNALSNAGFLEAVLRAFGANARQQPQLDCDVSLRAVRWLGP